jgi:hypothetical protein
LSFEILKGRVAHLNSSFSSLLNSRQSKVNSTDEACLSLASFSSDIKDCEVKIGNLKRNLSQVLQNSSPIFVWSKSSKETVLLKSLAKGECGITLCLVSGEQEKLVALENLDFSK